MKKYLSLVFVMIFALVLVGCGGGSEGGSDTLKRINVKGASQIEVGKTETYTTTFDPADYANKEVTWSTSDETALTIDQTGKATGKKVIQGVYVFATSKANNKIKGQKKVYVVDGGSKEDYPNLNGYNIKIAQAEHALGNFDPFNANYTQLNKDAKQQAWKEVQEDFNCTITVDPYPSSADWGPARWKYIIDQAAEGVADFDFYTVPDSRIAKFVDAGALISVDDFYTLHGKEMMDPSFISSSTFQGQLYGLCEGQNNIYAVMYYNIGLLEELQKTDPTLEEPAKLFNEGKWTYDAFLAYLEKVQKTMETKYGALGIAGGEGQEYFAASGYDSYWYAGLTQNDGDPIANIKTMSINLDSEHRQAAAEVVKKMYQSGFAAKEQYVDQNVKQWNEGKALFNTGDLWFVGDEGRWKKTLWGEDTRYGYVPWPMPNDMTLDDYKVALGGTALWVMPIGRNYAEYGEECTPENIYWAVCEMIQRTKKYYEESPSYDKDEAMKLVAGRYAQSDESAKAYITIQKFIEDGRGYYDPMCVNDNPVGSLYQSGAGTLKGSVGNFASGKVATWTGAIQDLVPVLQENLTKAFN